MFCAAILIAVFAVLPMSAQAPAADAGLRFEVATMKPTVDTTIFGQIVHLPGESGYRGVNMPLLSYLSVAYQVRVDQITVPDSFPSGNFDVEGKAGRTCTADELHTMLQHLLEERFHLQLHRGSKQVNGYALVVDKGGPKVTEHDLGDTRMPPLLYRPGPQKAVNATMQYLAFFLSQVLGQTVVDKTGLSGHYDFALTLQLDPMMTAAPPPLESGGAPAMAASPVMTAAMPSTDVFEALRRQVGLRLDKAKVGSVQIVIDRMEKLTEN
jgi:uncharacterized protein (TIGR03435 family)